ncbi:tagaturonate reductase [Sutcliffiella deserti]|uniref:tagaturonate reductase n=1 Tax=Sutcliffiella deserti TaxID=2875501 RepID=UPI001CBFD862|nr:tagaturonate reductase [Sutcliffiella deserti]
MNQFKLGKSLHPEEVAAGVNYEVQDNLPERIIQFGEGNFLRGFVDWMVHEMNKQGLFNGKVVAIQPTPHGKVVPKLNAQDGLYTLTLRGMVNGEKVDKNEIISSISRGINPYSDWREVLKVAESPDIRFVFSNTTEAGLTYLEEDYDGNSSPLSFPGKLAAFLQHRFQVMGGGKENGLTIIPCELVENNGEVLKNLVLRYAEEWSFAKECVEWIKTDNRFCNTLVDRIVTGYPRDNEEEFRQKLGYEDVLMTVGEPYHLFVIEAGEEVSNSLPFTQAGLNVKWGDVTPQRNMKVRLLNGPHTMMFATCYLSGAETVLDAMKDSDLREFVEKGLYQEILPYVAMDEEEKKKFADSVVERFLNPFTKHYLNDIGMNAVYKFKSRLVPSLKDYVRERKELPGAIAFSLAALIVYYKPIRVEGDFLIGKREDTEYVIRDNKEAISLFQSGWNEFKEDEMDVKELVSYVLQEKELWDMDLREIPELKEAVTQHVEKILSAGMKESVKQLLQKVNK